MKPAYRKPSALGIVMGILAGMVVGMGVMVRDAGAHADPSYAETPTNLRVEGVAGSTHNAVTISWDEEDHRHDIGPAFLITLYTKPIPSRIDGGTGDDVRTCVRHYPRVRPPAGCFRRTVERRGALTGHRYSIRVTELQPETRYYVHVRATFWSVYSGGYSDGATATITTTASPENPDPETPDPETPTTPEPENPTTPDPETPTVPETPTTPDPETPDCTYKHRLIGVPGTTGGGYTSQILISSEASNATATITAYQNSNGHQIDVLSDGSAIGSSVSLAPANSVKVFRLEEIRGWLRIPVKVITDSGGK